MVDPPWVGVEALVDPPWVGVEARVGVTPLTQVGVVVFQTPGVMVPSPGVVVGLPLLRPRLEATQAPRGVEVGVQASFPPPGVAQVQQENLLLTCLAAAGEGRCP